LYRYNRTQETQRRLVLEEENPCEDGEWRGGDADAVKLLGCDVFQREREIRCARQSAQARKLLTFSCLEGSICAGAEKDENNRSYESVLVHGSALPVEETCSFSFYLCLHPNTCTGNIEHFLKYYNVEPSGNECST
jgi:hypothetical protein